MSFKRGSLHGIDRNEKSSPLKKQLGEHPLKSGNILGDDDYVDVELETVLTRKRRKTANVHKGNSADISHSCSSSGYAAENQENDDLLSTCNDEECKEPSEISTADAVYPECAVDGDFSPGDGGGEILKNTGIGRSNEFLEIEAKNGECHLHFLH